MQFFLIRAKTEEELEAQRQQRMEEAVRKELEKANKPKRPVAPKKTEWEVEMIKGKKSKFKDILRRPQKFEKDLPTSLNLLNKVHIF